MWKLVTRGIRETFERRACRTNIYSQSPQDNVKTDVKINSACRQNFVAPIFITCDKGFCRSTKSTGAKDKEENFKWDAKHSWPEAVGWSSVLAAGWVMCQTLCLRKKVFERDSNETLKNKLVDYASVSNVLTQLLNLKPRHILPVTNCVGNSNENSNLQNSESQWSMEKQFGPITVEEALEEATDKFTNIHEIVIGELALHHGIKALEEKRDKDALKHFAAGAKLLSPGCMFNLGLCYELGIGTLADQNKAAKYYNAAAAYDHADAMYNLGVFHAQGKGGLPIDIDTARIYFTKAAKLGQPQAQHALDLEKTEFQSMKHNDTSVVLNTRLETASPEKNKTNNVLDKLSDRNDHISTSFIAKSIREISQYNDRLEEDPTKAFLSFLGIREPSQTPVIIPTNDCHVTC